MNLLWKKTYILSTTILRPHRHLYWNSIVYTIHDKNSDFLDDNGEGKNIFLYFYLVKKLWIKMFPHSWPVFKERKWICPQNVHFRYNDHCCEFFWWITNKKIQSPLFSTVAATVLNGFCKFLFSLTDIKRNGINNKTFRYREKKFLSLLATSIYTSIRKQ